MCACVYYDMRMRATCPRHIPPYRWLWPILVAMRRLVRMLSEHHSDDGAALISFAPTPCRRIVRHEQAWAAQKQQLLPTRYRQRQAQQRYHIRTAYGVGYSPFAIRHPLCLLRSDTSSVRVLNFLAMGEREKLLLPIASAVWRCHWGYNTYPGTGEKSGTLSLHKHTYTHTDT